jgi:hypothetical protein
MVDIKSKWVYIKWGFIALVAVICFFIGNIMGGA